MDAAALTVGRWQLRERIGAGRTGHVHRATDRHGQAGEVAVKLLAPGATLDDPAAEARFRHEVAALAAVRHPAVIPLLDHGVDPELGPYLVTPLVRGRSLRALIGAGATVPMLAALAGREIAGALGAIHAAGLVHRDLKPENVMIGDDGAVIVLDLGLAWAPHHTRYTEEGAVAGSVPYMAPEQIEGADPSPATDCWALGVILHEWIAGARPFARGQASEEVAAILAGARPALAERDPRVPAALGALVDACLTRDRAARPADGAALAARLAALAPGDAAAALRDPAGFAAAEAARQVTALTAEARQLLDRGRPFAAAPLLERAARYRPDDLEILALAERVGRAPARRPRWPIAVALLGVAALVAIVVAVLATRGGGDAPAVAQLDAGPAPLSAGELPEQAPALALDELVWHRGEAVLPHDAAEGAPETMLMGSREAEVAGATDPAVPRGYARDCYSSSTRFQEGDRVLAAAQARFPDDAPLWLLRGQVETRYGHWDAAGAALDQALALDPRLVEAWASRAYLHRLHGRLRAAFADVTAGRALAPDDAPLIVELVALHVAVGRGAEAQALARHATEVAPTSAAAWIALADTSDEAEAYVDLAQAVRLDGSAAAAWKRLCLLGSRLDRPEVEHDCYEAKLKGDYSDPDLVLAESSRRERAGDLEGALNAVWGARRYQEDVRLLRRGAELLERKGDHYGAAEARQGACALGDASSCVADNPGSP